MKKNFFILAAISLASFVMFSCSSSDDKSEDPKDLLELPYSTLTPSEQKKKLSSEGEAVLKLMKDLPNEASFDLIASFAQINSGLFDLLGETPEQNITESVVALSQYYGEYEWNAANKEWNKTENDVTDKLIAIFPAVKGSASNNGKIELKAVASGVNIKGQEVPSSVVAELFVSDVKKGGISIAATGINESTFAETANTTIELGAYKLAADIDKKNSNNVAKAEFTKESNVILDIYADFVANVTATMLGEGDVSSVKDANFRMSITDDLAIVGYVDGKSLLTELKEIAKEEDALYGDNYWYDGGNGEREEASLALAQRRIEALNNYSNLALVSTKESYKIAKVTFDLDFEEYESIGYKCELDEDGYPNWDTWEEYDYTGYETSDLFILNFDDETKVDAQVFFGEGFSKIIEMWNDFVLEFN